MLQRVPARNTDKWSCHLLPGAARNLQMWPQCVAVCCSVLQCVEKANVGRNVLQYAAVCCSVLQCVAVCFSVLQCVAYTHSYVYMCVCASVYICAYVTCTYRYIHICI